MEETSARPEPKVSVILVAFNAENALRRSLTALESSKGRDRMEILLVDCGSTDAGPQLDQEFPAITILRLPHHFGATRALNIASRTAKGEYVLYLDPFVEVEPSTVMDLAAKLDGDPESVAATPLLLNPDSRPVSRVLRLPTPKGEPAPTPPDMPKESFPVEFAGREALLVRRAFIQGMNYLDSRYGHFGGDLELAMQIRRAQKKIRLHPSIRAIIHPSPPHIDDEPRFLADRDLGLAEFLAKYYGFGSGLKARIGAILRALFSFQFGRLTALISGRKVNHADPA